jgi:xanthine/uracil permease
VKVHYLLKVQTEPEDDSIEIAGREIEKGKVKGGLIATVGYLLSPVSWWNDLFVNIPLAYAFGALFGLISEDLFLPAMVIGYWITNILGFVLMHRGINEVVSKKRDTGYSRGDIVKDLTVSVVYTVIVVVLVAAGFLRLPAEYFP